MKVEGRREGKDDEEGEFGKQRREKRGKTEVEEKKVMKEAATGGVPGIILKEIRR